MVPEQRRTTPELLHNIVVVAIDDFVRDFLLAAVVNPVRIEAGAAPVNGEIHIGQFSGPVVSEASFKQLTKEENSNCLAEFRIHLPGDSPV